MKTHINYGVLCADFTKKPKYNARKTILRFEKQNTLHNLRVDDNLSIIYE